MSARATLWRGLLLETWDLLLCSLVDARRALRRYCRALALRVIPGRRQAQRIAALEAEVERLTARVVGLSTGLHAAFNYAGVAVPDVLAKAHRPHLTVVNGGNGGAA
ncbi:MAG: hypothetical protein ACYCVZ_11100 [Streptosporangiaceae bacterium]